jgi:hypothetical protein
LTIPQILSQGKACGEHTESDYTCSKDHLSHTVRHIKYCENGVQKFVSLACNGAGETRQWEDITAEVQGNQARYASTLGGCEILNLNCGTPIQPPPNPTRPPAPPVHPPPNPTSPPATPTAAPTAVPTTTPTPTNPPVPQLSIDRLEGGQSYYFAFTTRPGDQKFGLFYANGEDGPFESEINKALAQQGIKTPLFKGSEGARSVYTLPLPPGSFPSLSYTLYARPVRSGPDATLLPTYIQLAKGCAAPSQSSYIIDTFATSSQNPCP